MVGAQSEHPIRDEADPRHVAIIMDGNGRWAKARGLARHEGHREGARAVRDAVTRSRELGLEVLTLYAFSAQNWRRPPHEVGHLMDLLVEFCRSEEQLMVDKGIRLQVIGQRDRIPSHARAAAERVESITRDNDSMLLQIALSYGGREEIVEAVRELAEEVSDGRLSPAEIDEGAIAERLWTAGVPDPDLVIRTSGELRLSNFLLWQAAYAELLVLDKLWPDFSKADMDEALMCYRSRNRRFGGVTSR